MKWVIIIGVVLTICVALYFLGGQKVVATNPQVIEKEVTRDIVQDALEKMIIEAQTASSSEIETKSHEAYELKKTLMLNEIELRVRKEYAKDLEKKQIELEKKVGSY